MPKFETEKAKLLRLRKENIELRSSLFYETMQRLYYEEGTDWPPFNHTSATVRKPLYMEALREWHDKKPEWFSHNPISHAQIGIKKGECNVR